MYVNTKLRTNTVDITLVNWLEAGLLAVVEADTELDLRDSAFSEVADGAGACRCCSSGSSGSSAGSGLGSNGSSSCCCSGRGSRAANGVTLIVDGGNSCEVPVGMIRIDRSGGT